MLSGIRTVLLLNIAKKQKHTYDTRDGIAQQYRSLTKFISPGGTSASVEIDPGKCACYGSKSRSGFLR